MQICITRSQWVNKVAHKVVFWADDMIFVNVYVYRIKVADKPQKLTKHMSMGLWIYYLMFVYICRWRYQLGRDKIRFVRKYIRTKFFGKYVSSNLFMNSLWPIDTTICHISLGHHWLRYGLLHDGPKFRHREITGHRSSTCENSGGPMKTLIVLVLLSGKKFL